MRRIGHNISNSIRIKDPIGGGEIELYYRFPTTEERQQYSSSLFRARKGKVKTMVSETRQRFGKKILTGFRTGDFVLEEEGKELVFSSDKSSSDYREDWKALILNSAADIVEAMAYHVFEGAAVVPDDDEEDDPHDDDNDSPKADDDGDVIKN